MAEIVLGVGGGIAAYKSCDLLRRLQDLGYTVRVVPTPSSLNFVGKATWEALSGLPVHTEVWESIDQVNHVKTGESADYIIVAPATADLIARISAGRADDLLTNVILASSAPKLIVPAMHPKMWLNRATQRNIERLQELGFIIMQPATGRLTGKDSGIGRFPEVGEIIDNFQNRVAIKKDLLGHRILVTTGGTRESIDDVRFIGNRSSGKQGLALCAAAAARGAEVTLIAANVPLSELNYAFGVKIIPVTNTDQLLQALEENFQQCDSLIMAAAISDAKPIPLAGKVKKSDYRELKLEQTPDLLDAISKKRRSNRPQIVVGFAAEEKVNLQNEGKRKLESKNLDLIYANDIADGSIFGSDETAGFIISRDEIQEVKKTSKNKVANILLDKVLERLNSANV